MQVVRISSKTRGAPKYRFVAGTPRRVERVPDAGEPVVFVAQEPWTPSTADLDRYVGTYLQRKNCRPVGTWPVTGTRWSCAIGARPPASSPQLFLMYSRPTGWW